MKNINFEILVGFQSLIVKLKTNEAFKSCEPKKVFQSLIVKLKTIKEYGPFKFYLGFNHS